MVLKKYLFPFLLITLFVVLFITNLSQNTYLSGWDNLQTELNPVLGIKRALFSVWQEYQSFGLIAGMGHAADLPRALLIWIASFLVPQSLIRYGYHMSMILIGGLGMYQLMRLVFIQEKQRHIAFVGSLFYIFNFNIIQMMFLPYEAFSTFVGFLPWLTWIFLKTTALEKLGKKDLLLFFLINLFATPAFVAQQLFVVYVFFLFLLSLTFLLKEKSFHFFKRLLILLGLIFIVNSYWVLPQVYFLLTNGSVVSTNKINQLATGDVFYKNKDSGNLKDFFAFQGFFYHSENKNGTALFLVWQQYRQSLPVTIGIIALAVIWLLGTFKKTPYRYGFLLTGVLIAIALLIDTPPFNVINALIRNNGFINQVFRSPFTKFSVLYALVASYFFASGVSFLTEKLGRIRFTNTAVSLIAICLILAVALPAFEGQYISPAMKVKIPQEYFQTFNYFQHVDKSKRIALLPEYTFWGWFYNNWGYNGSGFIWYGIEQPIISRTFDVWSNQSESYFWEVKTALEAEDIQKLENVLEKYDVDYLIYDHSLTPVVANVRAIQYATIDSMLSQSNKISLVKRDGVLAIYKVTHNKPIKEFVSIEKNLPNIGPAISITNADTAYIQHGDYQTTATNPFSTYYPFLDLTTQTKLTKTLWYLSERQTVWYLTANIPKELASYTLSSTSARLAMNLYLNNQPVQFVLPVSATQKGTTVTVVIPKVLADFFLPTATKVNYCRDQKGRIQTTKNGEKLTVKTTDAGFACFRYEDIRLDQRYGYIVKTKTTNQTGQPLFFYILDTTKEQPYIETRLQQTTDYEIIGSRFEHGLGYAFTFQNTAYKNVASINTLEELGVYFFPYDFIKALSLTKTNKPTAPALSVPTVVVQKDSYYRYVIDLADTPNASVILHQSYSPGWVAYAVANDSLLNKNAPFIMGKPLPHAIFNNWANTWQLDNAAIKQSNNLTIILFFWPQYLEYAGFFLLLLALGAIALAKPTAT